jgi:phosphate transport system ATP-binding protein
MLCTPARWAPGETPAVTTMENSGQEQEAQQRSAPAVASARPAAIRSAAGVSAEVVFQLDDLSVHYGKAPAVLGVSMGIHKNSITALIGPSGCGKSTVLRCLNRMNDLVPSAKIGGKVLFHGVDLYGARVDPIEVRRRIGMVFQRPNPFPKSIYDNVAYGLRILGMKDHLDDRVEQALKGAALWDEVKNRLKRSALGLSGGQQQRLCIARAIAVQPDVILLDEPASALDPISTQAIEDLMHELKTEFTLVIVTHNMQQAARVAEMTAFFSLDVHDDGSRNGILVEYDATEKIFTAPSDERTEGYVTGRFG